MQSKSLSIYDLFDHKRRYIVPLFQRQYVWRQDIQWEPLWEDIRSKAIIHLEHPSDDKVAPHFLGALVINQIQTFGNAVPAYTIIDGQQRLTTFQIFLAAFRDVAKAHQCERYAEETDRYIFNTGLMEKPETEKYKVFPTKADQPQFKDVIGASSSEALEQKYPPVIIKRKLQERPRMIEAYLYFVKAINEFLDSHAEFNLQPNDLVEGLYHALRRDLQVVSIELEGQDDPQLIFETLNARGEPLLASDLLRNFLFRRAEQNHEDSDRLYNDYWVEFEREFWRTEFRQGRLKRARIDIFMQHFLALKRGTDVNVLHLFQEYKTWIKEKEPYDSVEAELKDLLRYAEAFIALVEPDATRFGVFARRLEVLDVRTIYPLALYLMTDGKVGGDELDGIAQDLESYLVRRTICRKTTKNYNKMFLQIMRDLQQGETNRHRTQELLLSFKGDAGIFPVDYEFNLAWLNVPVYERIKTNQVEMVLRATEDALHQPFNEEITINTPLTIEHVMPQNWEANWPLNEAARTIAALENEPDPATLRDSVIQTFGNLTLLTQPLNSSVSNAAYEVKRPHITAQSSLRLNSYFQSVEEWNESAIVKRGQRLFEAARQVWPYPTQS